MHSSHDGNRIASHHYTLGVLLPEFSRFNVNKMHRLCLPLRMTYFTQYRPFHPSLLQSYPWQQQISVLIFYLVYNISRFISGLCEWQYIRYCHLIVSAQLIRFSLSTWKHGFSPVLEWMNIHPSMYTAIYITTSYTLWTIYHNISCIWYPSLTVSAHLSSYCLLIWTVCISLVTQTKNNENFKNINKYVVLNTHVCEVSNEQIRFPWTLFQHLFEVGNSVTWTFIFMLIVSKFMYTKSAHL